MPLFNKKLYTVEARRLDLTSGDDIAAWCDGTLLGDGRIAIETLEGEMVACLGDWVIKGVKGEFYPCKPDVFEASYEPVVGGINPWPVTSPSLEV